MSDPLKGRGLNRKTCGRRAREAARRPPSKPETVATRASVVRDLPPKHGTPRPLGAHISCSRHLCQGNGALPRGRPASEGLQSKSARVLGPFPQRPQNLPLIFPSSTHDFTPESLTIPHPLTPPSICSCLWLLKPPRLSRCSSGDHNSPQNESLGVPMAPCSYQQIDMIPLFYAVLYRMSR